jgi:hypothetical protein
MITKTIGILFLVIGCVLIIPVAIAVVGGVFGIAVGIIGGVFGAIFGVIGAVIGGIVTMLDWIFGWIFDWDWPLYGFWSCNPITLILIAVIIALLLKSRRDRSTR